MVREPKPPRLKLVDSDREGVVVEILFDLVVDVVLVDHVGDL
jgi:hypothetical protein